MALHVGSKVVLTDDTAPEPEVGTIVKQLSDDQFLVRWARGWMVEIETHHTALTEVHASLTPKEA